MRESGTLTRIPQGSLRATTPAIEQARSNARIAGIAALALFAFLGVVATLNLNSYPAPWFDEGSYLQVARNLAHGGAYAQLSADGVHDYAPAIGVGPTLLAPVAFALRLSGDSLAAARMVTVLYLLVATALIYVAARYLFGRMAALATIGLLLALPALDWVATGRQVLGEVPAIVFLMAGGIIATRYVCFKGALLTGLLLGLTLATKGQYLLVLPATILALALVDRFDRRLRSLRWFAVVLVTALGTWAAWMGSLVLLMGSGHVAENVRLLRESSSGALIVFNLGRMAAGMKTVLGPSSLFLVVPATIAGLLAIRRAEGSRRFGLLALWMFQSLWFGWFVFASIAWPRYAFPALGLNSIFAGWMLVEAVRLLPVTLTRLRPALRVDRTAQVVLAGLIVLALVGSAAVQLRPVVSGGDHSASDFAATLDRNVPKGAVIDGWEPEIGFLSGASIQYPPLGSLDKVVRGRWLGGPAAPDLSEGLHGEYVMVGPFARWVGVYDAAITSERYVLVEKVGEYELWKRLDSQ